jgi:hypothetical protein
VVGRNIKIRVRVRVTEKKNEKNKPGGNAQALQETQDTTLFFDIFFTEKKVKKINPVGMQRPSRRCRIQPSFLTFFRIAYRSRIWS